MITYESRIGRFTSSNIYRLTGTKTVAKTYIDEKRAERCLGRSIDLGANTQPMVWGKVLEYYLHEYVLGFEYNLCSKDTETHPEYKFWSGSPDFKKIDTAVESKCFYPKRFFELSRNIIKVNEGLMTIEEFKKEEKEVFWQVFSNAMILGCDYGEIIAYTPTEAELLDIRNKLENTNLSENIGLNPWDVRFIHEKPIYELPYIPEHSNWPNMVKLVFKLSEEDKVFLTKCVLDAEEQLTIE